MTTRGTFAPHLNITDARQRWLFRMVHSERPLQEKMALFWHNHFATAYTKIAGAYDGTEATRMLAAKPSEDRDGTKGQLELFREYALGNFRDLLIAVSKDPAILVWLDGRDNIATRPQENYAREVMELFTFGVANVVEDDVKAAARVFTGWNLTRLGPSGANYYRYEFRANRHDNTTKDFTFPIYPNGSGAIAANGEQEGIDLHHGAVQPPGHRAAARAQALGLLRQRNRRSAAGLGRPHRRHLLLDQLQHARGRARDPVVAGVLGSGRGLRPLLLAGRVRRPIRSRRPAGPAIRWTRR